ncbi:MAG: hypothetical protein PCFJNLEI_00263 [Verrucomicrobiae bacterium]|nr:hypothetical protein [Verrucomicrobiae bacterium]
MITIKPIRASQNASCLLVSICLLGQALVVPLALSSAGLLDKMNGVGSGELAVVRGSTRDSAR